MTEWEAIEEGFTRLRDFVLKDVEGYAAQKEGGNFAVVALVLAACDALGSLRYGGDRSGDKILARCLPEEWQPAADILYDALRNGLIHDYEAKFVVDGVGASVGFSIGWDDETCHMQFLEPERRTLYIAVPSLVRSLRATFADVERELRESVERRREFLEQYGKGRVVDISQSPTKRLEWRRAVQRARICRRPEKAQAGATGPTGYLS
jgi:hypothetical protein